MVCTCERLMVQFAHVPGSGGKSSGEAGPESGAVVDCLFSLRLLEKAQQHLCVCRLFLFKESKLLRLLRSLKGCSKAHSPSQDFLSFFLLFLDPAFRTSLSRATRVKQNDPRESVSQCSLKLSGAFLALSESLRLILFSK